MFFTSRKGYKINYITEGSGQPLLLLHNAWGSWRSWKLLLPLLTPRHRVYALDLLGFGESDLPAVARRQAGKPKARHSLELHVEIVREFVEELNLEGSACCGYSFGGTVALKLAASHPRVFSKLILIEARSRPIKFPRFFEAMASPPLGRIVWGVRNRRAARRIAGIYVALECISEEMVEDALKPSYEAVLGLFHIYRELDIDCGELFGIPSPVLLIWGERGIVGPSERRFLEECIPKVESVVIPGTDHGVVFERPRDVAVLILSFLGESHSSL